MIYNAEMETKKERKARLKAKRKRNRKDAGLCTECGKGVPVANKALCQSCLNKHVERRRNRKDAGLCSKCGKGPLAANSALCQNCIDKRATKHVERSRNLKDAGLCWCGKGAAVANKALCQNCIDKREERRRNRKDAGLCSKCGKHPTINASTYCEICTLKVAAQSNLGSTKRYEELKVLFIKQKCRCPYTGILLKIGTDASLDHIIPVSKGGSNDLDNLQWVHKWVNLAKSDYSDAEFRDFINRCYRECHKEDNYPDW